MKRYIIEYYEAGDTALAIPNHTKDEYIETENEETLHKYLSGKVDSEGNMFIKDGSHASFGFTYVSHAGAIKVKAYFEPVFKAV